MAQQQLLAGRHAIALAHYRDLAGRFPGAEQLWFEMGMAAAGDLNFTLADQAFRRALELAPKDSSLLVLIGQQYHRLRRLDQARSCFQQAAAADPHSVHASLSLGAWLERERHLDDAWECVENCLARHPQDAQALYYRAFLLHRQGRNEAAETALRDLIKRDPPDLNVRCSSRHLLGVVLDALGQYKAAMGMLHEAKRRFRQTANADALAQEYDKLDRQRRAFLSALTAADIARWRAEGPATPSRYHLAFLGGHPRSGTTLLEQILGAHPAIRAFDEPEAFGPGILSELAPRQAPRPLTPATLGRLPKARLAELRGRYLKSLLREVDREPTADVLLDKDPSATASLYFWLRVFPELKVIIALRDPRDVVVSCFFQNQMLTASNVNFLSLEGTAKHYADLMDVWLRLRDLGGFDWIEMRYEEVVGNLEVEGRRVMEFLGLAWRPEQASFHEKAQKQILFAPTYDEVTKPVHARVVGRWHHYAEELEPVQARLAIYCRAFGYNR